jgi:hypothetical protein
MLAKTSSLASANNTSLYEVQYCVKSCSSCATCTYSLSTVFYRCSSLIRHFSTVLSCLGKSTSLTRILATKENIYSDSVCAVSSKRYPLVDVPVCVCSDHHMIHTERSGVDMEAALRTMALLRLRLGDQAPADVQKKVSRCSAVRHLGLKAVRSLGSCGSLIFSCELSNEGRVVFITQCVMVLVL